ncbi:protein translocase subunit SecDF [Butyrivibrio sp. MC2013]|uniref:protein translocase subunit SecDF n=1 Tax=Butyrivibrio sp. MC2013 TaxID=1280686 RepID=UPI0004205E32|nr:protein translocase subunit SecDF [Butyrivibrio sp. MC2013]
MKKIKQVLALVLVLAVLGGLFFVAWFGIGASKDGSMHDIQFGLDLSGGVSITYQVEGENGGNPTTAEMDDTIYKLQRRVESELGTTEASVYREGENRINVEIPGATDEIFATLSTPGNLYFIREFNDEGEANYVDNSAEIYGMSLGIYELAEGVTIDSLKESGDIILEGKDVAGAQAGIMTQNGTDYVVELTLTDEGKKKFADATTAAVVNHDTIGIYYDGEFVSVPTVESAITAGVAQITHMSSYESAQSLASTIRIGGLDVSLTELRANVVGAQLGSSAIHTSKIAAMIGLALIVLFMVIIYRVLGVAASLALGFYSCLVVILLSAFNITLTLPGIAGIILSIGMAVDANVLVFSRIREELANGTEVQKAVKSGYSKALSAILDGNITTLIAALVLGLRGSGTVKGFAITLALGIIVSMFTALFITRIITRVLYNLGFKDEKYYGKAKAAGSIDFVKRRNVFFAISCAIIVLGLAVMGVNHAQNKGAFNLAIDFAGGTSTTVVFDELPSTEELENDIEPAIIKAANDADASLNVTSISHQVVEGENTVVFKTITLPEPSRSAVEDVLETTESYAVSEVTYESISATISNEMTKDAIVATILALILMLAYIWLRFRDLRFGASAIIALAHDAAMVIMCYAFTRIEVGSTFIAAVLTIIGYSINDTIVTFDRIRENQHNVRTEDDLKELVNKSVNQTLTRSLFTSITTFIMVLCLFIVGVEDIRTFALPLMIGVIAGTYSSICIAAELWFIMKKKSMSSAKAAGKADKNGKKTANA